MAYRNYSKFRKIVEDFLDSFRILSIQTEQACCRFIISRILNCSILMSPFTELELQNIKQNSREEKVKMCPKQNRESELQNEINVKGGTN